MSFAGSFGPPLAAALLAAATACGPGEIELRPGDTLHPNEANAPPPDASLISADSLPEGLSAESLQAWKDARDAILGARTVLMLGKRREEGPELFGALTDVEVDRNGNVVVFDAQAQEVRVFDPSGRHLASFGGEGDGPMEFRSAARLAVLADRRVAVPTGGRAIKVFAPDGDGWKLDTLMATPSLRAEDACVGGDGDLYITDASLGSSAPLHRIPVGGAASALGFGTPYDDESRIVRWKMSEGLIACAPALDQVAYARYAMPLVRAYSGDGGLLWTARVAGPKGAPFVENADGGGGFRTHVEHDMLLSLAATPCGHLIVQYVRLRRRRPVRLTTYLVDAHTGMGASLGEDVPPISSVHDDGLVIDHWDPYPRIEVREWDVPLPRPAASPSG